MTSIAAPGDPISTARGIAMPVFIASCVAATGMESVERIEADDIKSAREALEARGFREIVFDHDTARYGGGAAIECLTPAEQRQVMRAGRFSLALWMKVWGKPLLWLGAGAGFAAWSGPPYGWFWLGIGVFGLAVAASVSIGLLLQLYNALVVASQWHRWDRTLALAKLLAPVAAVTRYRQLAVDIRIRTARALIGKGRVQEAMESVADLRDGPTELGRVAELMRASGAWSDAIALKQRSAEMAPDHADGWIDYAAILIDAHRAPEARAALARAQALELTALARLFSRALEGMIALEEGDGRAAAGHLAAAIQGLSAHRGNPIFEACELRWIAYLALALAAAGNQRRARECFARCRAFLVATAETELLDRARASIA